ncbi:MAG TPA: sn-glycerol-3-phosphate ABC transporter ATP-binding protein UgpC [Steroidobacteraceae bacterium]
MAEIKLVGVTKVYPNGAVALHKIDLKIADRAFLVVVGPSGCGKSTLLRLIAGLETLTEGRVLIGDRDVSRLEPAQRDIAMVFQNYALYPHMNVYDNMAYGLRNRKVPKAEIDRRVRETARTLGLETMLARRPRQLSGGQRQRVAMGRAIVRSPAAFLFDEPLSNLDAKLRVQMRGEIKRLQRQLGTTGVYVTHDQAEAMTMGDQLVVLREGRVEQIGSPLDIYRRPATVFVGGFIGSPSMNFLSGRVDNGGRHIRVADAINISLPGVGLVSQEGHDLIVGIRPEHFRINTTAAFAELPVELIEPLGAQTLLEVRLGKELVTVSVDGAVAIKPGDRVPLSLTPDELHLFDRESEARIEWSAA